MFRRRRSMLEPHGRDAATLPWLVDRARRGASGALSPAIRSSGAETRSEGLAFGVSTPQAALTARSCGMWAREPGQVRKEAALSGSRRCRRQAWPEPAGGGHARRPSFEGGAHGPYSPTTRVQQPGLVARDAVKTGWDLGRQPSRIVGVED